MKRAWLVVFIIAGALIIEFLATLAAHHKQFPKGTYPDPVKQARLEWNLQTTVEAYRKAGFRGYYWDGPAILALTEFAYSRCGMPDTNEPFGQIIATNANAAIRAGCKDPLVNYLYIRFAMDQANERERFADSFMQMMRTMNGSTYPPVRKFYAAARTMDQTLYTYGYNATNSSNLNEAWSVLEQNLLNTLSDKTVPPEEAYEVAELATTLDGGKSLQQMYQRIEPLYFQNWPNDYTAWLLKGEANIRMAWAARGGGYADTVSDNAWKTFKDDLNVADMSLAKAWGMCTNDERIPIQMIKVCEGLQKPRGEMETWFNRAMAINPDSFIACEQKLHYLYPQWYGSREDMVAFGRQCLASTNWGGYVPLMLYQAHSEFWFHLQNSDYKKQYWQLPDVWPDVEASFERFFKLNPEATAYYHNYTWCAYQAEQWDKLNELIPKLGPVNYGYFGGEDEYNKMVALAKEHAKK